MTRESFGTSLSRLAALAFALVATVAVALAIAPGPALANTGAPGTGISPEGAGTVTVEEVEGNAFKFTATAKDAYEFENWTVKYGEYTYSGGTANPTTQSFDEPGMAVVTANFKLKSAKQDWTGTTTVEGSALYGETGTVSIYGYLPTDANVEIPEGSVSVSDPDGVLDSWSFNNVDGIVTYTFVNDSSKSGKQATISATVKSDKYNDYTGSVVLTVLGKVPTTYKISVSSDPSAGGTATADKQEAAAGDIVKLTATPADRSWEFVGWKTDPAVTITDDAFTMPSSNVAVTAVFKKASTSSYAITFDANGGTGSMDKLAAEEGATVTLTANAFTRSGYTFTGWNTAKDGSGTTYDDKASVKVEGDMALYAQWKASSSGSASSSKSTLAKTGDATMPMAAVGFVAAIAAGALLAARRRLN